jgi:gamma-glutamylcysteine synthetase
VYELFGQVESADLLEIARQINTFTEQHEDNQKLTAIRKTVHEAEVIVFLGFTFHERNMELLSPGDNYRAKKIYLTRKGISDSDMQVVISSINSTLRGGVDPNTFLGGVDPYVFPFNSTCKGLFNEYWRSLES